MIREIIYKDRDNKIDLQLSSSSGVADLSGATKIELVSTAGTLGTVSSTDHSTSFDWSGGNGVLVLSLGCLPVVVGSSYQFDVIVYDDVNENGINWGSFQVWIK